MPRRSGRFDRCVAQVRGRGGIESLDANIRQTRKELARLNPASEAQELSEAFHGREAGEETEIVEDLHEHEYLTTLGELVELKLKGGVKLKKFGGTLLASNEAGTQMYLRGGDQAVSLADFPEVDPTKELVTLGKLQKLVYVTDKQHLGREDRKRGPYEHELGEESGRLPDVVYDVVNAKLLFSGGSYHIDRDMDGGYSAGVRD